MAEDITELLQKASAGDKTAESELIPLIYDELCRRAAYHVSKERSDHTLQATALVHEVYLRISKQRQDWQSRAHFFGVASHLMRCILVDHARAHRAQVRGGGRKKVSLDSMSPPLLFVEEQYDGIIELDNALTKLGNLDARAMRVVELRFYCDLTLEETAQILGVSERTVKRDWSFAQTWLFDELSGVAEAQ
jgi:RNA polymerase sigma-70 factor (ECF subfamily)